MIDPYTQGELLLSFVSERARQRAEKRRVVQPDSNSRRFARRLIHTLGGVLIHLGNSLLQYGDMTRPTVATTFEVN